MAHDVFISYSSHDKVVADAICATLEQGGIRCWIAPRDVLAGRNWAGAIVDAINHARAVVLVFSGKANTSDQVEREVHQAFSKELPVIPVRIEHVEPEGAFEFWLRAPHWLDAFPPPLEQHFGRVVETVRRVLAADVTVTVSPAPEPPPVPLPVPSPVPPPPEPQPAPARPVRAKFIPRVKNILLSPRREWTAIAAEATGTDELYLRYVLPLAAIGPVAAVIGLAFGGHAALPALATFNFFLELGAVWVAALIFSKFAPKYGGKDEFAQAMKLSAYCTTPAWLGHAFNIIPIISLLSIPVAVYSIYLAYVGATPLLGVPRHKAAGFTTVTVLISVAIVLVSSFLIGVLIAVAFFGK